MSNSLTIPPCARCNQPGIVTTISGSATWPKAYDWSNSFVVPESPEHCLLRLYPRAGWNPEEVCTSGACKSPEDAVTKWREMQSK